jgi:phosphoserine phosphatase
MTASRVRLVCFDLNGTLIKENSWLNLNLAMGVSPEEDLNLLYQYQEGKITYQEGLNKLLPLYKRNGKFQKEIVESALFQYTYCDGAKEIISYLQNKKYIVGIISGSFDVLVEKVAQELGITLWAANNKFIFDDNGTGQAIECEGNDNEFKENKMKEFCSVLSIAPDQCACVGDSDNDREMFRLTGKGIAIEGTPVVKDAWKTIQTLKDLQLYL